MSRTLALPEAPLPLLVSKATLTHAHAHRHKYIHAHYKKYRHSEALTEISLVSKLKVPWPVYVVACVCIRCGVVFWDKFSCILYVFFSIYFILPKDILQEKKYSTEVGWNGFLFLKYFFTASELLQPAKAWTPNLHKMCATLALKSLYRLGQGPTLQSGAFEPRLWLPTVWTLLS